MTPASQLSRSAVVFLSGVAGVFLFLCLDASARAREAVREADLCARWALDPAARRLAMDERFRREQERLGPPIPSNLLSFEARSLDMDILRAGHARSLSPSAAGWAARWYQDAYRLFSPLETQATRRARLMAPYYFRRWLADIRAQGLPDRPLLLDRDPGLPDTDAVVTSAGGLRGAESSRALLAGRGFSVRVARDPRSGPAGDGYWVIVPQDQFESAHAALRVAWNLPLLAI